MPPNVGTTGTAEPLCPIKNNQKMAYIFMILLMGCNHINGHLQIQYFPLNHGSWSHELSSAQNKSEPKSNSSQRVNEHDQGELRKGIILPRNSEHWEPCCIYIPTSGIKLYTSPNGDLIGKLELKNSDSNSEYYESRIVFKESAMEEFQLDNFEMVGYEIFALKYIDYIDSFYQLENKMWVDMHELQSSGLIPQSWFQYAIDIGDVLGWYGNEPGIELRSNPNTESETLKVLKGDLLEIKLSKTISGNWIKVRVNEYEIHPCNEPKSEPIKAYEGWIELISVNGTLNLWKYSKGC